MKFTVAMGRMGLIFVGALALAACGDSDDASDEVVAEDVEIGADEQLDDITDMPVDDDAVATPAPMPAPPPMETQTTEERVEAERERMQDTAADAEKAAADIQAELEKMQTEN